MARVRVVSAEEINSKPGKDLRAQSYIPKVKPPPKVFVGKKIKVIRHMTAEELASNGWDTYTRPSPLVIVLNDNTRLYASCDDEGNRPGTIFVTNPEGGMEYLVPEA